jgi:hypothetical protein
VALADTANLLVKLSLGGNFLSQIGKATTGLNKFDKQLGRTEGRAFKAGQQIGTGIKNAGRLAAVGVGFLVSQVTLGLQSLIELEQATAQTNAVIKSTGGIAGITADEVQRLSEKFESLNATIGDEFITSAQNMLLTFTNVRGKAFEPALQAILNMNTALGKGPEGLQTTAIQVGKALQDPIKGVATLRRVGVQLSKAQEDQIKTLVEQNRLYEAQGIIIGELDRQFGGSFLAQGNTTAGKVAKFTDSIDDLQRALAEALLPTLGNVADALSKTLADPKVVAGVRDFGKQLAELISPANLAEGGRILGEVFNAARAAAPTVAAAARIMGQVVGTAVKLFSSLPKEIQQLAIGAFAINKLTGGLVTNIAGGLIGSVLKQLVAGVVNVRGASVIVTGAGGIPGVGGPAGGGAGALGLLLRGVFPAAVILGIGTAIGDAVVSAMGGQLTDTEKTGTGRVVGEIAGLEIVMGQNTAALVRNASAIEKQNKIAARGVVGPEIFGPPKGFVPKMGGISPDERDERLAGIIARAAAGGRDPKDPVAAAQATLGRNMVREQEKTKAAIDAVKTQEGRTTAAALLTAAAVQAADRNLPTPQVTVLNNITAGSVSRTIVIQRRYSPHTPSRHGTNRGPLP